MVEIGKEVEKAAEWLRKGEVVGIPTETVYGLAGNALDSMAIAKIFDVKKRPMFNPLILHTDHPAKIPQFATHFPPLMQKLANTFWPGPLTMLLPKTPAVPDLLTAGNSRVAIRIPRNFLTLKLLAKLDFPLAAPSANPSGYISPTTARHVAEQLGESIPYILDGGKSIVGLESTIIGLEADGSLRLYRLGGLSLEKIEEVVGPILPIKLKESPQSSGQLKSHYAPEAKLFLGKIEELWERHASEKTAILRFDSAVAEIPLQQQFILSPKGDLNEAAANLFAYLRNIDKADFDTILTEKLPAIGLGPAINDRLTRAQHEFK
ncbi:MAG: threonylcarbamoyl-AMP synthase [Bacteroidia bacterium]|nr:threonylcarbamoyl-AMP synthase [Bacteroidia bacterium]